jgi:hypothetical protein
MGYVMQLEQTPLGSPAESAGSLWTQSSDAALVSRLVIFLFTFAWIQLPSRHSRYCWNMLESFAQDPPEIT